MYLLLIWSTIRTINRSRRDSSHQKYVAVDNKPRGTKRGEELNGYSLLVEFIPFNLPGPSVGIILNNFGACGQDAGLLLGEDIGANPI